MTRVRAVIIYLMASICLVTCTRNASNKETPSPDTISPPATQTFVPNTPQISQQIQEPAQQSTKETKPPTASPTSLIRGNSIVELPVTGLSTGADEEISGMAWYQDRLILLPQYPDRFGQDGNGKAFSIQREDIVRYVEGTQTTPIPAEQINFADDQITDKMAGFQGYEAIAIQGNQVYLTIEAGLIDRMGYMIAGQISPDGNTIQVDPSNFTKIPPQTNLYNYSDESLLIFGSRLVSIYEVNGSSLNPHPVVHLFDFSLQLADTLVFPNVEFRITDATSPDEFGRFWAINDFYPGDEELLPTKDPLETLYPNHLPQLFTSGIERLVEFQFSESGVVFSETPPIELKLREDGTVRNWEAIARLEGYGLIIATDKYPSTIIAYIPFP